jgi:hypothetical protein
LDLVIINLADGLLTDVFRKRQFVIETGPFTGLPFASARKEFSTFELVKE